MISALNPIAYGQAFSEGLALLTRHAGLTVAMAKRDLTQRYAGQLIGPFWIVGHPLFLTALYVFVFGVVFKTRMGGTFELPLSYTPYILSGLIPWLTLQTAMAASCASIVSNTSLVKQFVFHLEVLPVKDVLSSTVIWFVGISATVVYIVFTEHTVHATFVLLPVAFALQILAMVGIAFLLSAVSVFFRDLKDFVTLFTTAGIFLMPVVYLPSMVPPLFRPLVYLNPFSYMIWVYQDILYFGRFEHPWAWVVYGFCSLMIFAAGYRVFRQLKPLFSTAL
jgi:lipopolysaccharide transport system permease protein